jgi:hypothetical protein
MAMNAVEGTVQAPVNDNAGDVLIRRPEQARLAGGVSIDTIRRWERLGSVSA